MQIIKEIREETGIPFEFWSYARLDLLRANPDMVDMIGEIGWTSFTFGIETFNKASGKAVGKGANPEKLKEFLINLRERYPTHLFQVNIIIGLPADTEESARETTQWFIDNPTVTSNVRIRELNIHTSKKRNVSRIAQDPAKFGYQVKPSLGVSNSVVYWVTETGLSLTKAEQISREMQDLINNHLNGGKTMNPATAMHESLVVDYDDETGMITNTKADVVRHYLRSKRKYRGV